MSKIIYVAFKVARMVDGDYIFISAEKAFSEKKDAENYLSQQAQKVWREDVQGYPCECERNIHECELF